MIQELSFYLMYSLNMYIIVVRIKIMLINVIMCYNKCNYVLFLVFLIHGFIVILKPYLPKCVHSLR
jgi:hypothetical protein